MGKSILKHLTITYNDHTLFDGEIAELIWSDTANGIKVEGRLRTKPANNNGGGGGLMDMLASLSKQKTAEVAAEKRADYEAEKPEQEPASAESG